MLSSLSPTYSLNSFMLHGCAGYDSVVTFCALLEVTTRTLVILAHTISLERFGANQDDTPFQNVHSLKGTPRAASAPNKTCVDQTTQLSTHKFSVFKSIHCFVFGLWYAPLHLLSWTVGLSVSIFSATYRPLCSEQPAMAYLIGTVGGSASRSVLSIS